MPDHASLGFTDQVIVTVTNAFHQEKGFFKCAASWKHPATEETTAAEAYGRGRERAIAYGLDALATELRRRYPEYPAPQTT